MATLRIEGGFPLIGEIKTSGSKNAALPVMAASLLTADEIQLENVPDLQDVKSMQDLLTDLGVEVNSNSDGRVCLCASELTHMTASYDLVSRMRASFLVLGPLLARFGQAEVSLPGGCAIGTRPVDQHIKALRLMGAEVRLDSGYVNAECAGQLHGTTIEMDVVTVGGTENVLMAATLAMGTTVIRNAAMDPEVVDLAQCLRAMGASISGEGTNTIYVEGKKQLHGCSFRIMPDRIEAGTYLVAAAATQGNIMVTDACPEYMNAELTKLSEMRAKVEVSGRTVRLSTDSRRTLAQDITTNSYPGIPTDLQAQLLVLNCVSEGESWVTETVFENRFMHVQELVRLGAIVHLASSTTAVIQGVEQLRGARVMATDLRASSCLVIGALTAQGESFVDRIYHIDRGYEHIEQKLSSVGACVERIEE